MPTILLILGWRLFFYANEGNEPIHVHCRKGDSEDRREIRQIVYEHFEYIEEQWDEFQRRLQQ
jgi:hypothetical protein